MSKKVKKFFEKFAEKEFDKVLEMFIIIAFYGFYLFSIWTWLFQDRFLVEMITYISRPFAILTSCYILQSTAVNANKIKYNYKPRKMKTLSFSKKITLLIIFSFLISVIFFIVIWFITDKFPVELMEYIGTPFITILPSYMAKAMVEYKAIDNALFAQITETITDVTDNGINTTNIGNLTDEFFDLFDKRKNK